MDLTLSFDIRGAILRTFLALGDIADSPAGADVPGL